MKNVRNLTSFFILSRGQFDNVFLHNGALEREIATSCMSKQFLDPLWCSLQDIFVKEGKESYGVVVTSDELRKKCEIH